MGQEVKPVVDYVIEELEYNTNQKLNVHAAMADLKIKAKKANYEDARAIFHAAQDRIGDDLIAMAKEPEKYSTQEMETIYGWFEFVCGMEVMMCNKRSRKILLFVDEGIFKNAIDATNVFYTDDPIDEQA